MLAGGHSRIPGRLRRHPKLRPAANPAAHAHAELAAASGVHAAGHSACLLHDALRSQYHCKDMLSDDRQDMSASGRAQCRRSKEVTVFGRHGHAGAEPSKHMISGE